MIELKFRAWDKHHKEMDYIHDLYWFEEQGIRDIDGNGHCTSYVIMQYANLHDMIGKELYDGTFRLIKEIANILYGIVEVDLEFVLLNVI